MEETSYFESPVDMFVPNPFGLLLHLLGSDCQLEFEEILKARSGQFLLRVVQRGLSRDSGGGGMLYQEDGWEEIRRG